MGGSPGTSIATMGAGRQGRPTAARLWHETALGPILTHLSPTSWACFDLLLVAVSAGVTQRVLVSAGGQYAWVAGPWLSGLTYGVCFAVAGLVFGLYERATLGARSRILMRSATATGLGLVLAYACIYLFFYGVTTRWLGVSVCVVYWVVAVPVRFAAHEAITTSRRRVLCVGCGDSLRKVFAAVARSQHLNLRGLEIAGHVRVPGEDRATDASVETGTDGEFGRGCPCLGPLDGIADTLKDHGIDEVVVGSELSLNSAAAAAALTCLEHGCRVTDQPTFVEKLLGEVPAEDIDAQWFLLADVQNGCTYETVKRAQDVVCAVVGLVLTLPLWGLFAAVIRLGSRGPVFFRQRRVGRYGREFAMYKFRTMSVEAEAQGARWADRHDPRVTTFGRFLRLSRLDELPQLWNILKGEMSFVGPRPERPEFVERLSRAIPHYRQRHLITPGLTGWAQIHFGYGATVEDALRKLCYDLYYLKHRSTELDFAIIVRTIGTFVLGAR